MATDDWKLQASFKFGRNAEALLNVRANTLPELDTTCQAVQEVVGTLVVLQEMLRAESVVTQSFPGTTRVDSQSNAASASQPAQAAETPPTCGPNGSHGPMVKQEAKDCRPGDRDYWWGWFCPLPKGTIGRCKAVYPGRR